MTRRLAVVLLAAALLATDDAVAEPTVLIVQGLGGNAYYRDRFTAEVDAIEAAAATLSPPPAVRVFRENDASREAVLEYLDGLAATMDESDPLFVFLIGHGSYDDEEYKFNIAGPDLTDTDMRSALDANPSRNQLVVNTSSASGAAAEAWADEQRIVISATRSGRERHATHFGEYFAQALGDETADVDKNQRISAQEAFNFADRRVSERFEEGGNLATEHARLDGQRAGRFTLARLGVDRPVATPDRQLAELSERRDDVAGRIETLRLERDRMAPEAYQEQLLGLMLELAEAEDALERRAAELAPE